MRVVIADDEVLLREGLGPAADRGRRRGRGPGGRPAVPDRAVALDRPDVAIVDIKMPPTHTDEGLLAAAEIRHRIPQVGVLLLSHYLDSRYAVGLSRGHTRAGSVTC